MPLSRYRGRSTRGDPLLIPRHPLQDHQHFSRRERLLRGLSRAAERLLLIPLSPSSPPLRTSKRLSVPAPYPLPASAPSRLRAPLHSSRPHRPLTPRDPKKFGSIEAIFSHALPYRLCSGKRRWHEPTRRGNTQARSAGTTSEMLGYPSGRRR